MTVNGCYDFNKRYIAVDITFECSSDDIDWFGFSVPEENVDEFDRAVPHMEQYFSPDLSSKLCDAWDEPEEPINPVRVIFFLRKTSGDVLETPYGNIDISVLQRVPVNIKEMLEFEPE